LKNLQIFRESTQELSAKEDERFTHVQETANFQRTHIAKHGGHKIMSGYLQIFGGSTKELSANETSGSQTLKKLQMQPSPFSKWGLMAVPELNQ
jgi:hypothetical protein